MTHQVLLTVQQAAARLQISVDTLNRWRITGEGPPFLKYGPLWCVTTRPTWRRGGADGRGFRPANKAPRKNKTANAALLAPVKGKQAAFRGP